MTTDQVIQQFNDAFQTRSPQLLPDLIAEHCVMNLMHVEDGRIVEALGYAKRP